MNIRYQVGKYDQDPLNFKLNESKFDIFVSVLQDPLLQIQKVPFGGPVRGSYEATTRCQPLKAYPQKARKKRTITGKDPLGPEDREGRVLIEEESRERERERERERGTTLESRLSGSAPRSQAAGCLIRLQLPCTPPAGTGGDPWSSPPGERYEQIRDGVQ